MRVFACANHAEIRRLRCNCIIMSGEPASRRLSCQRFVAFELKPPDQLSWDQDVPVRNQRRRGQHHVFPVVTAWKRKASSATRPSTAAPTDGRHPGGTDHHWILVT